MIFLMFPESGHEDDTSEKKSHLSHVIKVFRSSVNSRIPLSPHRQFNHISSLSILLREPEGPPNRK
jgi:hypothetical protein